MGSLNHSMTAKMITCEDEILKLFAHQDFMAQDSAVYLVLAKIMDQIHSHTKKSSENAVVGGNFFFKITNQAKPVLLFASQIKTERPSFVLNPLLKMAICFKGTLESKDQEQLDSQNAFEKLNQMTMLMMRTVEENSDSEADLIRCDSAEVLTSEVALTPGSQQTVGLPIKLKLKAKSNKGGLINLKKL